MPHSRSTSEAISNVQSSLKQRDPSRVERLKVALENFEEWATALSDAIEPFLEDTGVRIGEKAIRAKEILRIYDVCLHD